MTLEHGDVQIFSVSYDLEFMKLLRWIKRIRDEDIRNLAIPAAPGGATMIGKAGLLPGKRL